jgi:hypothetical protein
MRVFSSPRRDITGFIVLLGFLVLAGLALGTSNDRSPNTVSIETSPDPSVNNTRASGSLALFEWTQRLGYHPEVWRQDFISLPGDAQVLFCIAPNYAPTVDFFGQPIKAGDSDDDSGAMKANALTPAEGRAIKQWVGEGHTLILFASSLPAAAAAHDGEDGDDADDVDAATGAQASFASEIGVGIESKWRDRDRRIGYAPIQPSVWTSGVDSIHVHPGYRLYRQSNDGVNLFGSVVAEPSRAGIRYQQEPVALTYRVGKGRVIAVADDLFGSNANLVWPGNAKFIDRVLTLSAQPGARILFDEYHRSFGGETPSLWAALERPGQLAFIQLAVAALIAALVLIPRLGRTEPLDAQKTRTSAEYIASLAGLYRNAGASGAALETVYRQFLREVCQRYGLPPGITLDRLAETAARRGGVRSDDLKKCLVACERALESPTRPSDRDLVSLVRAIEGFRKEMGIG